MSYEINVSKKGRHYFSTDVQSLKTEREAQYLYNDFTRLFPESKGYEISVNFVEVGGRILTDEFKDRSVIKVGSI